MLEKHGKLCLMRVIKKCKQIMDKCHTGIQIVKLKVKFDLTKKVINGGSSCGGGGGERLC